MFEHYIKEQQELLPYLDKYYQELKSVDFPEIGIRGINWDESRIKFNVNKWLQEIRISTKEIRYAYCFSKAYNLLRKKYLEDTASDKFPRGYEIILFELPFWIRSLLDHLHSFREKVAHLIFDLYDQSLVLKKCGEQKVLSHSEITFFKAFDALKIFQGSIQWIPPDDHQKLITVFKSLCNQEIKELFEIRNGFTHRSEPPIEATGTGPIILGGKETAKDEFTVYLLNDETCSYQHIESLVLKSWDRMREAILSITGLRCFE